MLCYRSSNTCKCAWFHLPGPIALQTSILHSAANLHGSTCHSHRVKVPPQKQWVVGPWQSAPPWDHGPTMGRWCCYCSEMTTTRSMDTNTERDGTNFPPDTPLGKVPIPGTGRFRALPALGTCVPRWTERASHIKTEARLHNTQPTREQTEHGSRLTTRRRISTHSSSVHSRRSSSALGKEPSVSLELQLQPQPFDLHKPPPRQRTSHPFIKSTSRPASPWNSSCNLSLSASISPTIIMIM